MHWRSPAVAVLVVAGTVGGCGAPSGGAVETLAVVPYDLMSPAAPVTTVPTPASRARPQLYFVSDDVLLPVPAPVEVAEDLTTTASNVLSLLAGGPAADERARGLSTALGPDVRLALSGVRDGTAVIDVQSGEQAPTAGRLPLAVGQIVLTVVSVPGIERVRLTAEGLPIEAPLPGGALSDRPLAADDYAGLVGAPPAASRAITPAPDTEG